MLYYLTAFLLVLLDQVTKVLVRAHIPLGGHVDLIPGVLDLTYVQNTGMAFSSFSDFTPVLAALSLIVSIALVVLIQKDYFHSKVANWLLALILAGAVGNLIDRVFFGFVTDMIEPLFVDFAVFNVADCFITVCIPLLAIYILFFDKSDDDSHKEGQ